MQAADYEVFKEGCDEQGVSLHPDLIYWVCSLELEAEYDYPCYMPSDMLAAVGVAGALLRDDPNVKLADRPIYLSSEISSQLAKSDAARALAGIINGSVRRLGSESGITDLRGTGSGVDACRAAEYRFGQALLDMDARQGRCQIIGDDRPALFHKLSRGVTSALSLRSLSVDGVPYPAGSIFGVTLNHAYDALNPSGAIEAVPLEEVAGVDFMRLSAFALGIDERKATFDNISDGSVEGNTEIIDPDIAQFMEIEEIERLVRTAYQPTEVATTAV